MFKDIYDYNLPISVEIQFTWQHSRFISTLCPIFTKIVAGVYTITNPIKKTLIIFRRHNVGGL